MTGRGTRYLPVRSVLFLLLLLLGSVDSYLTIVIMTLMYNTGHTIIRIYTLGGFILLPFFFLPPSKLQFKLDDYYVYTVVLFPFLLHFFFFFNFVVVFSWELLFQWHLILFYSRFLPSSDFDRYRLMYITTRYSKFYFIWSDTFVFLCVCVCWFTALFLNDVFFSFSENSKAQNRFSYRCLIKGYIKWFEIINNYNSMCTIII